MSTTPWPTPTTPRSGITTTTSEGTTNNNGTVTTSDAKILQDAGTYGIFCLTGVGLVLFVSSFVHFYVYLKKLKKKLMDKPNIYAIFKCVHNISDLWTDFIFTIILYLQKDELGDINSSGYILWIVSLVFFVLPFILQCGLVLWYIQVWQDRVRSWTSLNNYPKQRQWFIILFTLVCGFYATIELTRSKIFYLKLFHSQLSESYYKEIRNFRFINVVIIENIPQMIIQCIYVVNYSNDMFVYLSMLLSGLSILLACLAHFSYCVSEYRHKSQYQKHVTIDLRMKVQHPNLGYSHMFCNDTFEGVWKAFLGLNEQLNLMKRLDDISYDIETVYISSSKQMKGSMFITIRIELWTNDNALVNKVSDVVRNCTENVQLKGMVIESLKLEKIDRNVPGSGYNYDDLQMTINSMATRDAEQEAIDLGKTRSPKMVLDSSSASR